MNELTVESWLTDEERLKLASALMSPGFTHYVTIIEDQKMRIFINGVLVIEKEEKCGKV